MFFNKQTRKSLTESFTMLRRLPPRKALAFKTVGKKRYTGKWSAVKSVKCK